MRCGGYEVQMDCAVYYSDTFWGRCETDDVRFVYFIAVWSDIPFAALGDPSAHDQNGNRHSRAVLLLQCYAPNLSKEPESYCYSTNY